MKFTKWGTLIVKCNFMTLIILSNSLYTEFTREITQYLGDVHIKKTPIILYFNMGYNSYNNIKMKKSAYARIPRCP